MKSGWLPSAILCVASFLVSCRQRAEWLREWRAELWYIPRHRATPFCLGAFRDALWLRRNDPRPVQETGIHLDSPLACLGFLAALAAIGTLISVRLLLPALMGTSHLRSGDLLASCMTILTLSCLLLPATRLTMGRALADYYGMLWPRKLRRAGFLILKIALMQPIMLCGFVVLVFAGRVAPFAPELGIAFWILALRWVLIDQSRRCPVCLRLLTDPVRIGTPSQTFLEWYGGESMCSHGHGLLQVPEISPSYSGEQQWLNLDGSWSDLFSEPVGVRQR